jgi:hypothetical protein
MNFRTTYILFGVLLVVIGLFAFALWWDPTARKTPTKYLLDVPRDKDNVAKTDDVTRVEIDRREPKAEKIVFERDGNSDRWTITSPRKLRADSRAVDALIQQLQNATREDKTDEAPNLAAWGLDPPQAVVTMRKKDKEYGLNLGKTNASGEVYVLNPYEDPKKPVVVKESRLSDALKVLDAFRDGELLAASAGEIQTVGLGRGKDIDVAWKKDDRGRWVYTEPKNYGDAESGPETASPGAEKAPGSMSTVLNDVAALKVEKDDKAPAYIDDVSDFGKYNLGPTDEVFRIKVTRQEAAGKDGGGPRTLLVGVGEETEKSSGKYYARLDGDSTVVRVSAKDVGPLLKLQKSPEAVRDRILVRLDGPPSAVRITNGYGEFDLFRTGAARPPLPFDHPGLPPPTEQWTLWRDGAPRPVDAKVMAAPAALVNLLRQKGQPPVIEGFIDVKDKEELAKEEKKFGLDRPRAVVSLWSDEDGVKDADKKDDKKKPELKSKAPTYRLSFGDPVAEGDKKLVAVKREVHPKDGDPVVTLVKITETALDEVRKGPMAYMDRTLERFTDSGLPPWKGVTKVVIRHGDKVVEAARDKDDAPWKIVKPEDRAGREAEKAKVEDLLGTINRLSAQQLVEEKAKDDDLDKKYGLKAPQARVEITVKKDDKPVTYDFGKDASDGGVYAKQSQRDTIFTVAKTLVSSLPSDLLDPVLFTLDVDKVRKVKLTGWQKLVGSPVTLEFERKDKSSPWEVKKGPDKFKLDAGKLETLLNDLHPCRAERFVEFKSGPKPNPKYKLEPADDALAVEITVEGEEKPITLTVGDKADDGFYAMTSRTDGDVVVLPTRTFTRVKEKPAYFSRP